MWTSPPLSVPPPRVVLRGGVFEAVDGGESVDGRPNKMDDDAPMERCAAPAAGCSWHVACRQRRVDPVA
jgi:hypothetical protein